MFSWQLFFSPLCSFLCVLWAKSWALISAGILLKTINSDRALELRAWSCRWSTNKKNHLSINFFFFFNSGKAGDSGSTSTSDTTRDDSFRSLFSNRLDDFMDSTSSTGDIFPPPLASSRSGGLKTALLGNVVADLIPPPCHLEDAGAHL